MSLATQKQKGSVINYFAELMKWRDEQRAEIASAMKIVKGKDLPLEINPMGLYRWYLHPAMHNIACRSLLFWMHEIPPGSRSGKQKCQGGRIHYVHEGSGYTILDDSKYEWEQGDLILIPIKPDGSVHQHFNPNPSAQVRLVVCEPNWCDSMGVDMGSGLEMLESCPEYIKSLQS